MSSLKGNRWRILKKKNDIELIGIDSQISTVVQELLKQSNQLEVAVIMIKLMATSMFKSIILLASIKHKLTCIRSKAKMVPIEDKGQIMNPIMPIQKTYSDNGAEVTWAHQGIAVLKENEWNVNHLKESTHLV